jgi:hypothetical protein
MELYDGSDPILVWGYDAKSRSAYPTYDASMVAFSQAVKRLGDGPARERYSIPAHIPALFLIRPVQRPAPRIRLETLASLKDYKLQPQGKESVAGFPCRIYGSVIAYKHPGITRSEPDTAEATPAQQAVRAWVEPETGLVLRLEQRTQFGAGSPVPPQRFGYLVKKFQRLPSIPITRFQLPPGAQANVPKIFAGVRLPAGVKRVSMTGAFAGIGVDLTHMTVGK